MTKRMGVESDKAALERQIQLIKELLLDGDAVNDQTRERLAFLNASGFRSRNEESPSKRLNTIDESASILSPSDIDVTGDDLNDYSRIRRKRSKKSRGNGDAAVKRPSAPPLNDDTPPKRPRSHPDNSIEAESNDSLIAITTVTVSNGGPIKASSRIETNKKNRSFSEPAASSQDEAGVASRMPLRSVGGEDSDDSSVWTDACRSESRLDIIPPTPAARSTNARQLSYTRLATKRHAFCAKTVVLPERCIACDKRIKFGKMAYKCRDCRTICHSQCQNLAPTPCSPHVNTPRTTVGSVIADFAPPHSPYIPPLVLYCVLEVEKRGLDEVGLYRVPGTERDLKELKEKFLRGKGIPNLTKYDDIHVVCGCLKEFLRTLREPLTTYALWSDFVKAAEIYNADESINALMGIVAKLPETNRDTLAYLAMHLQLVARSPSCRMPIINLSRVFGPTVVGYSCPEPDGASMLVETNQQTAVMQRLLMVSEEFWSGFISREIPKTTSYTPRTPAKQASRPGSVNARSALSHTPFGSSTLLGSKTYTKQQQQYFASPNLQ